MLIPSKQIATGATAATVCVGNDSRLSDARTPTGAAGGDLGGTYANPTVVAFTDAGPVRRSWSALSTGCFVKVAAATVDAFTGSVAGSIAMWDTGTSAWLDSSRAWALGAATAEGATLENTTAAALGAQQWSPSLNLMGRGWATGVNVSQTVGWRMYSVPVQAATNANCTFYLDVYNAGAWYNRLNITAAGAVASVGGNITAGVNLVSTNLVRAGGDGSGAAGYTSFSNATLAAGSNPMTFINAPYAGAQSGWLKGYQGTSTIAIPYWPGS